MSVKQISVFLETTTDGLMQFTKVLQENNIDIRAFSIAEALILVSRGSLWMILRILQRR